MKKATISELRKKALEKFNNEYIHNMEDAKHIINIYYRLVPLEIRNLENETENNITKAWYKYSVEKEHKMYYRLLNLLKPYGLELSTAWIHSSIVKRTNEYGGVTTVFDTYFYD